MSDGKAVVAQDVFGRHLDLAPLRGRRHGLVKCPFRDEKTGSLSVDLDLGLFNCFGCGAQGGVRRFAELVGEQRDDPGPHRPRRHPDRLAPWVPLFRLAHFGCHADRVAASLRREATMSDPADEATWNLLQDAVRWEQAALVAETVSDEVIAEMRRR